MSLPDDVSIVNARPNLAVADVERSVAFYRDVLGFEATAVMGEPPDFALLHGGRAEIALVQESDVKASGCYVYVTGVEALLKHCEAQGVKVTYPLTLEPWGILNFVIEDPDGHRIAIGERQESGAT